MTYCEAHITRLSHEGIKHANASARETFIFLAGESFKQDGSNRHVLINTHSASDPRTLNNTSTREFCDRERKISSTMFTDVGLQYSWRRSDVDRKRHGKVASPFFVHIIQDFFQISRTWHSRIHQLQVEPQRSILTKHHPLIESIREHGGRSDKHVCLNSVLSGQATAQASGIPPGFGTHAVGLSPGEKGTCRCTRVLTCNGTITHE